MFKKIAAALKKAVDVVVGSVATVCAGPAFFIEPFSLADMIVGMIGVKIYILAGLTFGLPALIPMVVVGLVTLQQRGIFREKGVCNVR